MRDILLIEHQCILTQHALQADMPANYNAHRDVWHQVWLACASLGCMYGRPSVTECDMHYVGASVMEHNVVTMS